MLNAQHDTENMEKMDSGLFQKKWKAMRLFETLSQNPLLMKEMEAIFCSSNLLLDF